MNPRFLGALAGALIFLSGGVLLVSAIADMVQQSGSGMVSAPID